MMVLLVAALVILGPERLPGAISWTTKSMKQVREYASGASQQLKDELGTDFDDLRGPLSELNQLRGMTPRAIITKHLLDGDDSVFSDIEKPVRDFKQSFDKPVTTPGGQASPSLDKSVNATPSADLTKKPEPSVATTAPPIDSDAT